MAVAAQEPGVMTFSNQPSGQTRQSFQAGESIYAQAQFRAPLERLPITRRVTLSLKIFEKAGTQETFLDYFDVGVSGALMEGNSLLLELAPDLESSRAYRDANLHFKTFGKRLDGPAAMCEILSRLSPGRHQLVLRLEQDGVPVSAGELGLEGDNYSSYAKREAQLKQRFGPK